MMRFEKLLVGVNLSGGRPLFADELSEPNVEAVRQAIWLARSSGASIDFVFVLDLSARARQLILEGSADVSATVREAEGRLAQVVASARREGVVAEGQVVVGKSWLEIIRLVLRRGHDLVLVGARDESAMSRGSMGTTAIKLLRKCPCAVWVTQPQSDRRIESILVAHDLRPVGDSAMELGCSMASLQQARLHVVHAAEYPEFDHMFPARVSAERKQAYRDRAEAHIQSQLARAQVRMLAKVHYVVEAPDLAIMHCVEQNAIDLLVMGTVGRTGISGFITGNTAERLLPRIPCSILAVKPSGFESPVSLA